MRDTNHRARTIRIVMAVAVLAFTLLFAVGAPKADAHVGISIGIPLPGVAIYAPPPPVYYPAPAYYGPAYYGPAYYGPAYYGYGPRYYAPSYGAVYFNGGWGYGRGWHGGGGRGWHGHGHGHHH